MSPLASTNAFLHSIMPEPVRSRSSFTNAAVIAISIPFIHFIYDDLTSQYSNHIYNTGPLIQRACYNVICRNYSAAASVLSAATSTSSSSASPVETDARPSSTASAILDV